MVIIFFLTAGFKSQTKNYIWWSLKYLKFTSPQLLMYITNYIIYWTLFFLSFRLRHVRHATSHPPEYKDLVLHMSINLGIHDNDIRTYIEISPQVMRHLRKMYCERGETVPWPVMQGQPWLLDAIDATVSNWIYALFHVAIFYCQFLEGCIERQPDMLLVELQNHLCETCNIVASVGTIARTLHRWGFTMKKVSIFH